MAALPVRYNALRMLALSGRCVIVDEAHALTVCSWTAGTAPTAVSTKGLTRRGRTADA
jgi:hypothetical protein